MEKKRTIEVLGTKITVSREKRKQADASQKSLVPPRLRKKDQQIVFATETELVDKALFGFTAPERLPLNQDETGHRRNHATLRQMIVLSDLENVNADLIEQGLGQGDRLMNLNSIAIGHMKGLEERG